MSSKPNSHNTTWLITTFLILIAGGLRLFNFNRQSLWIDELFSVWVAGSNSWAGLIERLAGDLHPPLYFLILRGFLHFGSSDLLVRIPSLLFGVLSVLWTYRVGRRLFDTTTGFLAALMVSAATMNVFYSQEARMYSLFCLLTLVACDRLLTLMKRPSTTNVVVLAIVNTLNLYTHYFALLVLLIEGIVLLRMLLDETVTEGSRPRHRVIGTCVCTKIRDEFILIRQFSVSILLTGLLYAPWIPILIHQLEQRRSLSQNILAPNLQFVVQIVTVLSGSTLAGALLGTVFIVGAFAIRDVYSQITSWGYVLVPLAITFLVALIQPVVRIKSFIFVLPFFYLSIARTTRWGASRLVNRLDLRRTESTHASLYTSVILITLLGLVHYDDAPMRTSRSIGLPNKPAWRQAATYIASRAQANAFVLYPPIHHNRAAARRYLTDLYRRQYHEIDSDRVIEEIWTVGIDFTYDNAPLPQPAQFSLEETIDDQFYRMTIHRYAGKVQLAPAWQPADLSAWSPFDYSGAYTETVSLTVNPSEVTATTITDTQNLAFKSQPVRVPPDSPFYVAAEIQGIRKGDTTSYGYHPFVLVQFRNSDNEVISRMPAELLTVHSNMNQWEPIARAGIVPAQAEYGELVLRVSKLPHGTTIVMKNLHFWVVPVE